MKKINHGSWNKSLLHHCGVGICGGERGAGLGERTGHTLTSIFLFVILQLWYQQKNGARNRLVDILYTPTLKSLANFRIKVVRLSLKARVLSVSVVKNGWENAKSTKASMRGRGMGMGGGSGRSHSVQKSSYYSLASTVLLDRMLVHGR